MEEKTITLRSRRSKYLRSFLSSVVFSILGIKLFFLSGSLLWILPSVFFVFAAAASFIPLLPNQSYLKVDKIGLTIRSMFKTINITWGEVENFYTERKANKHVVTFRLNRKKINFLNLENLTGKNERLPDDYGMEPEKLADLLEHYRIRYSY